MWNPRHLLCPHLQGEVQATAHLNSPSSTSVYTNFCALIPKTQETQNTAAQDLGVPKASNPPGSADHWEYNLSDKWVYHSNTYHIKSGAREQLLECTWSYLSIKVSVGFWVNLKILALKSHKKNNPANLNGILKKININRIEIKLFGVFLHLDVCIE